MNETNKPNNSQVIDETDEEIEEKLLQKFNEPVKELKYKIKGDKDISGKPKVYFTCHYKDKYMFDSICDYLFDSIDCVIYYAESMSSDYDESFLKDNVLSDMNLFVFPITFKLLNKNNRAMDFDLAYARNNDIAVLPLLMEDESAIVNLFREKFGDVQYLVPEQKNATQIPFEIKLKEFIQSVLTTNELRNKIMAEFEASVFLSYRKKDRKYANQLMRLIHQNPLCRDFSIWYDEYLVPGENYNDSIDKALRSCDIFALLATPNLNDPTDNYVARIEYPIAREIGKKILCVEMTDFTEEEKALLLAIYKEMPALVSVEDEVSFHQLLTDTVNKINYTKKKKTPYHNYLIGLAYLNGIGVEKNNEVAIKLIKESAENRCIEAIDQLAQMYYNGLGVNYDWNEWIKWLEKGLEVAKREYGNDKKLLILKKEMLADGYHSMGNYTLSETLFREVYQEKCKEYGEEDEKTIDTLSQVVNCLEEQGNYKEALEIQEKVYESRFHTLGEKDTKTIRSMGYLAWLYQLKGDYSKAVALYEKQLELYKEILGQYNLSTLRVMQTISFLKGEKEEKNFETLLMLDIRYRIEGNKKISPGVLTMEQFESINVTSFADGQLRVKNRAHIEILEDNNNDLFPLKEYIADFFAGREEFAKEYYWEVIAYKEKRFGVEHPVTLNTLEKSAKCYDFLERKEILTKVYERRKQFLGIKHPETLRTLSLIADLEMMKGDVKKGEEQFINVIQAYRKVLGSTHPNTIEAEDDLAWRYSAIGEHDKALELLKKVCEKTKEIKGELAPNYLYKLERLAEEYFQIGNLKEFYEINKGIYDDRKEILGEDHSKTVTSLYNLAKYYWEIGDKETAYELYKKVVDWNRDEHCLYKMKLQALYRMKEYCNARVEKNESEKAILLEEYLFIADGYARNELGIPYFAKEIYDMVLIYLKKSILLENKEDLSRFEKCAEMVHQKFSKGYYDELYHISKIIKGENHPDTIRILRKRTDFSDSLTREYLLDLFKKYKTGLTLESEDAIWILTNLTNYVCDRFHDVNVMARTEDMQEALEEYTELCRLKEEKYGKNHPETLECIKQLSVVNSILGKTMQAFELAEYWLAENECRTDLEKNNINRLYKLMADGYLFKENAEAAWDYYKRIRDNDFEDILRYEIPDIYWGIHDSMVLLDRKSDFFETYTKEFLELVISLDNENHLPRGRKSNGFYCLSIGLLAEAELYYYSVYTEKKERAEEINEILDEMKKAYSGLLDDKWEKAFDGRREVLFGGTEGDEGEHQKEVGDSQEIIKDLLLAVATKYEPFLDRFFTKRAFKAYERAINIIKQSKSMEPDDIWGESEGDRELDMIYFQMVELTNRYYEKVDYSTAWYFYNWIYQLNPQIVLRSLSVCCEKIGMKDEAANKCRKLLENDKSEKAVKLVLEVYTELGMDIIDIAYDMEPQMDEQNKDELLLIAQLYGSVLQKEYTLKAFEMFERAIEKIEILPDDLPEDEWGTRAVPLIERDNIYEKMVKIADRYMEKGDLEVAWYFYNIIAEKAPNCVLKKMAACSIKMGKTVEVVRICQDYYKKEGDRAMKCLIDCYNVLGIDIHDIKMNFRR